MSDREPEWRVSALPVPYQDALAEMERRAAQIASGGAREMIWLLEHPSIYTAGTSADANDLLTPERFPVFRTPRGGQYTYHGPGQRIIYVMLNLGERRCGARAFVCALETWLIDSLALLGVAGARREGRTGVWTLNAEGQEAKIAALGIRIRRGVSLHGASINVAPDLSHFDGIVPCGLPEFAVTSLQALGHPQGMAQVDDALRASFADFDSTLRHSA